VFIPSKPGKYGLLLCVLTDASVRYVLNIVPYSGKVPNVDRKPRGIAQRLVHSSAHPFKGSGRNATTDRFYTDVKLAEDPLRDKLTVVGTMNMQKRDVPACMRPNRSRPEMSYADKLCMVSFMPSKNESVILLSSTHNTPDVSPETQKPEIIMFTGHCND